MTMLRKCGSSLLLLLLFFDTTYSVPSVRKRSENDDHKVRYKYDEQQRMHYITCKHLNTHECNPGFKKCETETTCYQVWPEQILACFSVVQHHSSAGALPPNETRKVDDDYFVTLQGCWPHTSEHEQCTNSKECKAKREHNATNDVLFCCCTEENCNENNSIIEMPPAPPTTLLPPTAAPAKTSSTQTVVLIGTVSILSLVALIVMACWCCQKKPYARFIGRGNVEEGKKQNGPEAIQLLDRAPERKSCDIVLGKLLAKGRYPTEVYHGTFQALDVSGEPSGERRTAAIKVMQKSPAFLTCWKREKLIYECLGRHPLILEFLGTASDDDRLMLAFDLAINYSLYEVLRSTPPLPLHKSMEMCIDILRALTYIHSSEPARKKNVIVHRDVKSRNILVAKGGKCLLGDFGLAVNLGLSESKAIIKDTLQQVGTVRYMSPQLLEGASDYTVAAFKQCDLYSMALVLWEIFHRTEFPDHDTPPPMLPFEDFVGKMPSRGVMHQIVVKEKRRPQHPKPMFGKDLQIIALTITELWEDDNDVRISAETAEMRFTNTLVELRRTNPDASDGSELFVRLEEKIVADHEKGLDPLQNMSQESVQVQEDSKIQFMRGTGPIVKHRPPPAAIQLTDVDVQVHRNANNDDLALEQNQSLQHNNS